MGCRHSLANGTCIRCYPSNPDDRHPADRIDPGPESDYEPNMEGPGAVAVAQLDPPPTAAETKKLILRLIRCYADAVERMTPVVAAADAWRDDPCKGLGSHREAALADAIDDYRAKVRGAKPDGAA